VFSKKLKATYNKEKLLKKCNSPDRLGRRCFWHIFYKMKQYVSVNTQLTVFQNCFAVLSRFYQGKG
jgi:hypothetical protein